MAKRLNKKVAIIGSAILALLMIVAILVVLNMSKDPDKFLADARANLKLAEPDYEAAGKAYGKAFAYTKDIPGKIDILFELVDMYLSNNEWAKAAGCWDKIVNYDTSNVKARLALLDYRYQLADSGNWTVWKDVESGASELIEKQLDTGTDIYMKKGRAMLELVRYGQATDKEDSISQAIEILQDISDKAPNNVDVYAYLSDAIMQKGNILAAKGILGADENAKQQAVKVLLKGVENLPDEPKAYINLYSMKFEQAKTDEKTFAELEKDLLDLTEKFSNSPLPYFALTKLYQTKVKNLEKAIVSVGKAAELDNQKVEYAATAAELYYRRYAVSGNEQDFQHSIDIAAKALTFPDSLDIPGPRARVSFINRYTLHTFLANSYVEKALDTKDNAKWLELAEQEIHEIDQLLGSAENPYAIMWRGRLSYAKGDIDQAASQLYTAYQALTAGDEGKIDIQLGKLSYDLAKIYSTTPEIGAVIKFYSTAIKSGVHFAKPQMLLDFAEILNRSQDWQNSIRIIGFYEDNFKADERSNRLKVSAYIGSNMFDEAKEIVAKMPPKDANTVRADYVITSKELSTANRQMQAVSQGVVIQGQTLTAEQLKAEVDKLKTKLKTLTGRLAAIGAKTLTASEVMLVCRGYIAESKQAEAMKFAQDFLEVNPDSADIRLFASVLAEPNLSDISAERTNQLRYDAVASVGDDKLRLSILGAMALKSNDYSAAKDSYSKLLNLEPDDARAIANMFDIALAEKDFKKAENWADKARQYNTDKCQGEFFKARLEAVRENYTQALSRIDSCLEKRPVFSQGYLLKSQIDIALEKNADAIADAKEAYQLNPLNGTVARQLASLLYQRNQKLGAAVTVEQITETKTALDAAIRTNQGDLGLLAFYADFISSTDPERAIAISQQIQKLSPSVENALRLAQLAVKVSNNTRDEQQKKAYMAIAEDACKQAYQLAPEDSRVLSSYSELLRATGRDKQAEELLSGSAGLQWRYMVRGGNYQQAQQILLDLYKKQPEDANTLRGLILIARTTKDQGAILRYTQELLKVEDTVDNQMIQMETYLEAGLTEEAEKKIESFRERFPDEPRAIMLNAWLLARQGKLDDALELTNRTLELDKDNAKVWQLRGQINLALNKASDAIDDLLNSKTLQDNAEVRIDLARAYVRSGRYEQAIAELTVAVNDMASSTARNMLEEVYVRANRPDRLERFYEDTIKQFSDDVYWHNRAANFAFNRQDYSKAYDLYDKAYKNSLKINSDQPDLTAFDGRLVSLLELKRYEQLLTEAAGYVDGQFATVAYSRMAKVKSLTGDNATAIQYFRRALDAAGTNESFIIETLQQMNQTVGFDETVNWCNEKLAAEPKSLAVNLAMFNLYRIAGQYNKAVGYIDTCIGLVGGNQQMLLMYRMNKANTLHLAYNKTGDIEYLKAGIKEYESILEKQPTNITVLNNIAYSLADADIDLKKALEYAKQSYEVLPGNANILDTYGYVLLKNGQAQKADEYLQRALQQFEQSKINAPVEVYEHIAAAKTALGQNQKAIDAYKTALEIAGEDVSQQQKDEIAAKIAELSS